MKKIFMETNIMLDFHVERPSFYDDVNKIFTYHDGNNIVLGISEFSIANTNYQIIKHKILVKPKKY